MVRLNQNIQNHASEHGGAREVTETAFVAPQVVRGGHVIAARRTRVMVRGSGVIAEVVRMHAALSRAAGMPGPDTVDAERHDGGEGIAPREPHRDPNNDCETQHLRAPVHA
jgi:hypothetical protein